MDIDIVMAWVDDSDLHWRKQRNFYSNTTEDCDAVRFRDWGLLKYWFRSVEKNMPWVRKIHFVTCGHYPAWLNLEHPKLHFVKHRDYIPEQYLPTFSARPIELNFHRIDGLSEHFVYFNDDMYPIKPTVPTDFFMEGLPCGSAVVSPLIPLKSPWKFGHTLLNDISVANTHFKPSQTLKGNYGKWFSLKYGRYLLKNVYNLLGRNYFLGFEAFHEPVSFTKQTYKDVWELEGKLLDATCSHRFRDNDDVNQYVLQYYQFCANRFYPRSPKCAKYFDVSDDNSAIVRTVLEQSRKFVIINDSAAVTDFQKAKEELQGVFNKVFPDKSSFEL